VLRCAVLTRSPPASTFNAAIEQGAAFPGPARPADFTAIDWQIEASQKASLAKLLSRSRAQTVS